jgi:hypothetical protein
MINIQRYSPDQQDQWNDFIATSINGLFMFNRNYMNYHSDRFVDHSLCFYDDQKLIAILPANKVDNTLFSHQGLTFGGIIKSKDVSITSLVSIFDSLIEYLRSNGLKTLVYKTIPHFYHSVPAQDDQYLLYKNSATVSKVELTTTINLQNRQEPSLRRKRCIKKAIKENVICKESDDWAAFWDILKHRLESKHNTKPTHSLEEILLLHKRFHKNIKLFGAYTQNTMLAGVVVFEYPTIAHAQYIASSDAGYECFALDILFEYIISYYYTSKQFFDFGISTENGGKDLNLGLAKFKEEFGGGGYNHITWKLEI